jgi:hypothetical protein
MSTVDTCRLSPPDIGQRPPALTWTGTLGQRTSLDSLRGAPVLLVFFADARMGRSERTSESVSLPIGAKPVGTMGPDFWFELDDGARLRMTYVHDASSPDDAAAHRYGVPGVNAAFLLDASGVVCWRLIMPPRVPTSIGSLLEAADVAIKPSLQARTL